MVLTFSNIDSSPENDAELAVIERALGEELLTRLQWMTLQPKVMLCLGVKIDAVLEGLQKRFATARLLACDDHFDSVRHALSSRNNGVHYVCGEASNIPLASHSVDLIFANYVLPWQKDFAGVCQEWQRLLRPNGLLILSTLGLDTLKEWRHNIPEHALPHFIDMHDLGDLLLDKGFEDPVLEVDFYTLRYKTLKQLAYELTATGMCFLSTQMLIEHFEDSTNLRSGEKWQVTYEAIFAHAFMPAIERQKQNDGQISIPLSQIRQQLRKKF